MGRAAVVDEAGRVVAVMGRLVAAGVAVVAVLVVLVAVAAAGVGGWLTGGPAGSGYADTDIPPAYRALYQSAAGTCPGLPWSVLAAVGKVETDHGRAPLPGVQSGLNFAGVAAGPMQFRPETFAAVIAKHPPPPGGAMPPSLYNPSDAIYSAAAYLCDSGARDGDLQRAIFTYNRSQSYVNQVLGIARSYAAPATAPVAGTAAVGVAIGYALSQLGQPYRWGADGPDAGEVGFDCSGLTKAAYAAAGIDLPRTAQTQYQAGPPVPAGQPLLPGDLLFYGVPGRVHHVGLYLGDGRMVHAPTSGDVVKVSLFRWTGDDFLAATRPTGATVPQ